MGGKMLEAVLSRGPGYARNLCRHCLQRFVANVTAITVLTELASVANLLLRRWLAPSSTLCVAPS